MISLRHEIDRSTEYQQLAGLREMVAKHVVEIIRSVADYPTEIDARAAAQFKGHIQNLQALAEVAETPTQYSEIHASFRGEMRQYRDINQELVTKMRGDIASAVEAMANMATSVSASGDDLGGQLKSEIHRLETAAATDDLQVIKANIREAIAGLEQSYEQLQRSNQLTVAQLRDEIRGLHKQLSNERRALYLDKESGAWVRQKLEQRIEDLFRQSEPFWVLFWTWEAKGVPALYPEAHAQLLQAMVKRLEKVMGSDALIGRWDTSMFAVIVELDPATEPEISPQIRAALAGPYAIQEEGMSIQANVTVKTASAGSPRGMRPAQFLPKLGQISSALR